MLILATAMGGERQSSACHKMRLFAGPWPRREKRVLLEAQRAIVPRGDLHLYLEEILHREEADWQFRTSGLSQTKTSRTSHIRPAHIDRLIPSARAQGHGDEYFSLGQFPLVCLNRSSARSMAPSVGPASRPIAGPASRYRYPYMAVPRQFEVPSQSTPRLGSSDVPIVDDIGSY
jgi:hypothetical protein